MSKEHDNWFTFNGANPISVASARFEESQHSATDGQPYDGVIDDGKGSIAVKAGRHGSGDVAGWFNAVTGGDGHCIAKTVQDKSPDALNFAVFGTLTLSIAAGGGTYDYCADNVCLAQGHTGTSNNWWIGSPAMAGVTWSEDRGQNADVEALTDAIEGAIAAVGGVLDEDPQEVIEAGIDLIKAAIEAFVPNNVGTGTMVFRCTLDNSLHLFVFEMGNSSTGITSLGCFYRPES